MLGNLTDRLLVEQFLIFRNEGAFSRLYDRHSPVLYRIGMQITDGHKQNAEEIVQITWMKAVQKLAEFRWESALRTWLISILVYTSKEHFRRTKMTQQIDLAENKTSSMLIALDKLDLDKALSELPPGYKVIFVLHDIEGYKHEEIGQLLGINEGTSKSQLFNARKMLRNYLMN